MKATKNRSHAIKAKVVYVENNLYFMKVRREVIAHLCIQVRPVFSL